MKKLQNNFTTPEQSKRLLELGVPADSADCYFLSTDGITTWVRGVADKYMNWFGSIDRTPIPCWSVGRLIEIFSKCYTGAKCYYSPRNLHNTAFWMERFDRLTMICFMDFSKLEE